jgi:hypothetical protein
MRLPCYADSPAAIEALTRDGLRLLRLGDLREAEYVLHRAAGGADHLPASPDVPLIRVRARKALAATYRRQGRHGESDALLRSTIALAERELGSGAAATAELPAALAAGPSTTTGGTDEHLRNPATQRLAYA